MGIRGKVAGGLAVIVVVAGVAIAVERGVGLFPDPEGCVAEVDGHPADVKVRGGAGADDDALDRCVEVVIEGLVFPASGLKVKVEVRQQMSLPPPRSTLRGRKCSPTSTLRERR